MSLSIKENKNGVVFNLRVQPRSYKNQVVGLYGKALKISLTAPPVDNAANNACRIFLASLLSVPKSSVTILFGHTGRNKQVMVQCPQDSQRRRSIRKMIMLLAKP